MASPVRKRFTLNGLVLDIAPPDVPENFYTESSNMVPRPLGMERALGWMGIFPGALFPPYFLLSTDFSNGAHWIYAGNDGVGLIDPFYVHTDITPDDLLVTVANDSWTGCNLNGIAVINAIENVPFYWFQGMAQAATLPGLRPNTRYGVMRAYKYHLIGLAVSDATGTYGDVLHWSDAADPLQVPDDWVPSAENEAGDNSLSDEPGAILDGLALRDSFVIYKADSVYEMNYVGAGAAGEIMSFRKMFSRSAGIMAANCVAAVKGTHVVLGNGDIYQHDGQNQQSLVDGKVREAFFASIDSTSYINSFVVYLEAREEVWICVPTRGSARPNLALVWNVTTREVGFRSMPGTDFMATGVVGEPISSAAWADDPQPWEGDTMLWVERASSAVLDSLVLCDAQASAFYLGNRGNTAAGEPYTSSVARLGLLLEDDSGYECAVRRVWPRIKCPQGMAFNLEIYSQRDVMAPVEVLQVIPFEPSRQGVAVNSNVRYLGFKVSTDESLPWSIAGIDVEFIRQGYF